jgi:hypothetical protein
VLRVVLEPRFSGTQPVLFVGAVTPNEPHLEVIADVAADVYVAFHTMVLRRKLANDLELDELITINYGTQRGAHNA